MKLSNQPAPLRAAILAALSDVGPMTTSELAEHMGIDGRGITACIGKARERYPGKLLRITGYRVSVGRRMPDLPIYSDKGGEDAKKPRVDAAARRRASNRRYRERNGAAEAAKKRIKKARLKAADPTAMPAVNVWNGLAPRTHRHLMTAAANASTLAEAA
ncbi:helix-turn-helix transcriptional regulator [Pseudorhodoferax sp. Leaf265]|uniref:helix-turn-helix transcriptional regulator n=1 Tax=Pseudorhodoferax sp. Leaf265 TaxID=1736315 RepID=UPI0006FFCE39|nr:helix-turn-helix transcriptional regulator [Pseudorhodoferax sp. Leaf265]KQP02497.1 hypothetical protein ASF45_20810 [Pseudorhodoferax sp. Leaf265]